MVAAGGDRTLIRQWREHGHRPASIGDLDRFAGLDPSQQPLAR
jgi:hypothetical protein